MEHGNIYIDHPEIPIVVIPKHCTSVNIDCDLGENASIFLTISTPYEDGNPLCIYSGQCNIRFLDSYSDPIYSLTPNDSLEDQLIENTGDWPIDCEDIGQYPVILSDAVCPTRLLDQSPVWIDPYTSPFIFNDRDSPTQQTYAIQDSLGHITFNQRNTFITRNVFNYDGASQRTDLQKTIQEDKLYYPNTSFDDDSESDLALSQLSKRKKNKRGKKQRNSSRIQGKNDALKQLMSSDIQSSSKQRKTILFLGEDSASGQTVQNIRYTDPMVKCSPAAGRETVQTAGIGNTKRSTSKKKQYQCDKCKQIFGEIAEFRQHMVGNHTSYKVSKDKELICPKCGRKFSNTTKYETHCSGHGDPDVECPKCMKVYASKSTLKIHMKIHNRKFPCSNCSKSYETAEAYKTHLKVHSKFLCLHDGCFFMANSASELDDHNETHNEPIENDCDQNNGNLDDHDGDEHGNDRNYDDHARYDHSDEGDQDRYDDQDLNDDNDQGNNYEIVQCDNANLNDQTLTTDQTVEEHNITENSQEEEYIDLMDQLGSDFEGLITVKDKDEIYLDIDVEENGVENNDFGIDSTDNLFMINTTSENNRATQISAVNSNRNDNDFAVDSNINDNFRDERVKEADSVLKKVISSNIFLQHPKKARKHAKNNKSCEVCSKSFNRLGDLKRHLIEHVIKSTLTKVVSSPNGFLDIPCEICHTEYFSSVDKYKAHLREHAKLTLYKCTFCDKSFSDSSNFSKHKKIHGVSYFQCDLCQRKYNSKRMITRHIELHLKNKPRKCKHCHRVFHFDSMLNKHIKSVHKKSASTSTCRFCPNSFQALKYKWDHEWRVHSIRDKIVDCLLCGEKFRKYSELKQHCRHEHYMDIPTHKKLMASKRR